MGSVTYWIQELKDGDRDAGAAALWKRYFERLVRYARRKLEGQPRRVADEEDVAVHAFAAFCHAARGGRFPNLGDRHGLWRLLLCITARKAADQKKKNAADGSLVREEPALPGWDSEGGVRALAQVVGDAPSPEVVAASTEACRRLLTLLEDTALRDVAILKLAGYNNVEVARLTDCALRTVERQVHLIRRIWERELRSCR